METYYSRNRKEKLAYGNSYYQKNKEEICRKRREARRKRGLRKKPNGQGLGLKALDGSKDKILAHYGEKCSCCGECNKTLLTVEHLNNDGHKTRNKGYKGKFLYTLLIKQGYPTGIDILCFNCNIGKRNNGGTCPHKD